MCTTTEPNVGYLKKMATLCFSAVKYFQCTQVSVSMFPDMCLHISKWSVKFYQNSLMEKENILK